MYKTKSRFYYHVTTQDWSDKITLEPISTKEMYQNTLCHRGWNEPDIARICVGPSVAHCLLAMGTCLGKGDFLNVYRTINRVKGYSPSKRQVYDSKETKEKWLLRPIQFTHVFSLPLNNELNKVIFDSHISPKESSKRRIAKLKILQKFLKKRGIS